jgi:hypothetical protein
VNTINMSPAPCGEKGAHRLGWFLALGVAAAG